MAHTLSDIFSSCTAPVIVTHTHPDGDALGSSVALQDYFDKVLGKKAAVIMPDAPPVTLDWLSSKGDILDASAFPEKSASLLGAADLIVALDLNSFTRTAQLEQALRDKKCTKVLIDHHLNPSAGDFDLVFSDPEVSSACELLYRQLLSLPWTGGKASALPSLCATALMTGMTTDTNNFANSVYPSTLSMASALLEAGVDRDSIISSLYNNDREERIHALAAIVSSMMVLTSEGAAYIVLDNASFDRFGLVEGETEGLVNIPLKIARVKISIFLREDDGHYRVSVRSKAGVSANRLCSLYFNGGGHEQAAGGKLFFSEDIRGAKDAAAYIEKVTARFLQ